MRFETRYMPILGSLGVKPGCLSVRTSTEGLFLQSSGAWFGPWREKSAQEHRSTFQLTHPVCGCGQPIDVFIDEVEDLLSDTRTRLEFVANLYEPAVPNQFLAFAAHGFTRDHEGIGQRRGVTASSVA